MMVGKQLSFSLPYRKSFDRTDFFVSACNQEAVSWIDKYPAWPFHAVLICGEAGSGKTHLASVFSKNRLPACGLTREILRRQEKKWVIEDVDRLCDEELLFHFYNLVKEQNGHILFTARELPQFKLPDLVSRMNAIPKAFISYPDEQLLKLICAKIFMEKNVVVEENVLEYAVKRVRRSFDAVRSLMDIADRLALSEGRRITIPLMKEALSLADMKEDNF